MAASGVNLTERQALEKCGKVITMLRAENLNVSEIDNEICQLYHYLLRQTQIRDLKNQKRREKRKAKKESSGLVFCEEDVTIPSPIFE